MKPRVYDYDALAADYLSNKTLDEIAREHGCCKATIFAAARAAGITKKPWGGRQMYVKRLRHGYVAWVWRYWNKHGKRRYHYFLEHRVVMEKALGRPLMRRETVHHKNGVRHDNRLENLELRVGNHGSGATHCRHCGKPL